MYCNRGGWPGGKLYCNTLYCIAEKEAWRVEFGLQYIGVYCNRRRLEGLKEAKLYRNTIGCIVTTRGYWVSHDTKFVS